MGAGGRTVRTFLAVLAAVLLASCAAVPEGAVEGLPGPWEVCAGAPDLPPGAAAALAFVPVADVSRLEAFLPAQGGTLWLRLRFSLPAGAAAGPQGLFLGRVDMADRTWLNGRRIGEGGRFPPGFWSAWNDPRFYPVPDGLLAAENELLVAVYGFGEAGIGGPVLVGDRETLAALAKKEAFFSSGLNALIAAILLVMSFYHFLMWWRRRADRENLYYALMAVFFTVYQLNFIITGIPGLDRPPFSYEAFQKVIMMSVFGIVYFFAEFIRQFLGQTDPRALRRVKIALAAGPACLYLLPVPFDVYRHLFVPATQSVLVFFLGSSVFLIGRAVGRRSREGRVLLVGLLPLLGAGLFDLVAHQFLQLNLGLYLTGYGFPFFLLAMLFILALRTARDHSELEAFSEGLEKKVEERTLDLQRTVDSLEAARAVAARDMAMAERVQKRFLPERPPVSDQWDVAFRFEPLSGVSGDFYDFYVWDGRLRGLCLFDVSGHGIASGLITMISRSVLFSHFNSHRKDPLDKVIVGANQELIAQIGNTDTYLTGIVLRFWDNGIEYLNAGHPDLLFRRAGGQSVRRVAPPGRDVRGRFLGIAEIASVEKPLTFRMEENDLLLLCTDGMLEARNAAGEEFGAGRLREILRSGPEGDAGAMADHLWAQWNAFIGAEPRKDDLTLVVVRRRLTGEDAGSGAPEPPAGTGVGASDDFGVPVEEVRSGA